MVKEPTVPPEAGAQNSRRGAVLELVDRPFDVDVRLSGGPSPADGVGIARLKSPSTGMSIEPRPDGSRTAELALIGTLRE